MDIGGGWLVVVVVVLMAVVWASAEQGVENGLRRVVRGK